MDLKDKIRVVLRDHYGSFSTYLESKYENVLTENLISGDSNDKKKWATYNQVILELKNNIKNMLMVKELQYKLTDNLDPNDVCISVLENVKNANPELERLYYKIKNFKK